MKKIDFVNGTTIDGAKTFDDMQQNVEEVFNGEEAMGSIVVEDIECKNLFDINTMVEGNNVYRNFQDGILVALGQFNSIKIPVNPNTTYSFSTNSTAHSNLCFFDNSMNYISGLAFDNQNTITTLDNCYYITIAVKSDYTWCQLEKGSIVTEYAPYKKIGYNSQESMGKIVVDDIECKNLLPVGETESITLSNNYYFDKPLKIGTYYLSVENITSNGTKEKYVFVFRNGNNNQDLYIYLTNSNPKTNFKTNYEYDRVTIYSQDDWASSQSITTTFTKTMLEKGSEKTPYTPYKIFNNKQIYSTTEQLIGEYLGQPLYRKVVTLSHTGGGTLDFVDVSELNILRCPTLEAKFYPGENEIVPSPFTNDSGYYFRCYIGTNKTTLTFEVSNLYPSGIVEAILEYTKATDTQSASTMSLRTDTTEMEETPEETE